MLLLYIGSVNKFEDLLCCKTLSEGQGQRRELEGAFAPRIVSPAYVITYNFVAKPRTGNSHRLLVYEMGRGATKATKKYAASGQLKKSIQARHKHQQIKKKIQVRKGKQKHKGQSRSLVTEDEEAENNDETSKASKARVMFCRS